MDFENYRNKNACLYEHINYVQVPGQPGGNISMCAAISEDGVVGRRPLLGSYNAAHLIEFLNEIEPACQGIKGSPM